MDNLFSNTTLLAEGHNSEIYLKLDSEYQKDVILKTLKEDYNFHPNTTLLANEDEHIRAIDIEGVRGSLDLLTVNNRQVLVLEYIPGKTLKELIKEQKLTLPDRLKIAISLCKSIGQIHDLDIIHKDLNSYNILVSDKGETTIIDFGLSTKISTKSNYKSINTNLEGTLPYISPEQTGRMNHSVDYRSDLYSFGIVLYELFSGSLPFTSHDPIEVVHAHLAVSPKPLCEVDPQIPEILSRIVLKLLAKNTEDRYQSAFGLLSDLEQCLDQLKLKVDIQEFDLAKHDYSKKFLIPSKLYGREKEIARLLNAFDQLEKGNNGIALIAGNSGTGKTALVYETHKPITQRKGNFISGKFEQYQKGVPYYAVVEAIKELISFLLTQDESNLAYWKSRIQKAIGTQGKVLTNLVPMLELIIGKQNEVEELGMNEEIHRLNYVFSQFIKAVADKEHPLVMFIDDLQWIDNASLLLLKQLAYNKEIKNFLFIGAYRANEVDAVHPFVLVREELQKNGLPIDIIELGPLSKTDINSLISDTLNCAEANQLAQIVYEKTGGNAFFVNQFLKSIHEQELINFELTYDTNGSITSGAWQWDIEKLKATDFTDNVVELMISKIQSFDEETRDTLVLAASIGDSFDLRTLEIIAEKPSQKIIKALWNCLKEQLIYLADSSMGIVTAGTYASNDARLSIEYKFAHDKIRQAAYELVPEQRKRALHNQIARLLLEKIAPNELDNHIFDIVHHFNSGEYGQLSNKEKEQLIELNYKAGQKAQLSSAYESALKHYNHAIQIADGLSVIYNNELLQNLFNQAMECAYLVGDYQTMNSYGDIILNNSQSAIDRVNQSIVQIHALTSQGKSRDAVIFGLKTIRSLGVKLPLKPNKANVALALVKSKLLLKKVTIEQLEEFRPMNNEKARAVIQLFNNFGNSAFHEFPELFPIQILKYIELLIKYGNTTDSIPAYAGYGLLECAMGNIDNGYKFGQLSLRLLDKQKDTLHLKAKTFVTYYTFIHHWKEHIRLSLEKFTESYQAAIQSGDLIFSASSLFMHSYHSYFSGTNLNELEEKAFEYQAKLDGIRQELYANYHRIFLDALHELTQGFNNHHSSSSSRIDELAHKLELRDKKDKTSVFHYYFNKLVYHYLLGDYELALHCTAQLKKYQNVAISTFFYAQMYFYEALALLQSGSRQEIKKAAALNKQILKWANHCPENFLHKYELVQAEIESKNGSNQLAGKWYKKAIENAHKQGFLQDAALANELAAKHYENENKQTLKEEYITQAFKLYTNWGATVKAEQLLQRYNNILTHHTSQGDVNHTAHTYSTSSGNTHKMLDLAAILKASASIANDIQLNKAIPALLKIIIENAGAQSGVFMLHNDDKLDIAAVGSTENGIKLINDTSSKAKIGLAASVIQFVKRSRENVVIDNAKTDSRFANDSYIIANNVRSVLCIPVINQGKLLAVIYLENNLVEGAFTKQRLELLRMLSGQIAVTLQNALLFDNLEQKVKERTAEIEAQKEELKNTNLELISINQEKDDLISIVSHDLRSPLNQIKGLAKIASFSTNDKEANEINNKIHSAADRLTKMITKVLDISALESQQIILQPELFNVIEQMQELVDSFQQLAQDKQIKLIFNSNSNEGFISLDKNYFMQIINNLLSNAIKFTPKDGKVEVIVSCQSGSVKIEVKDNGPGISERDQKRLFNKFQRLTAQPTGGEASSGLGLAIVKKYVDAMQGKIWCESELDQGTSFFVEFVG